MKRLSIGRIDPVSSTSLNQSASPRRLRPFRHCLAAALVLATASAGSTRGEEADVAESRWNVRLDVGGTIPVEASLTEFGGPVSGESMELTPGVQLDVAAEYQLTPWLGIGPELGFTINFVDNIAGVSTPDTSLWQMLLMANAVVQYPTKGPVRPFVGAGAGGVVSFLTFYDGYYGGSGYYWGSANTGSDFVFGYQAFGGVRLHLNDSWSLGVIYRYLQTDPQRWSTDWGWGGDLTIGVDTIRMHSICLVLSGSF